MTGKRDIIALAGFMRQRGESDAAMNRLLADKGLLSFRRWRKCPSRALIQLPAFAAALQAKWAEKKQTQKI